MKNKFSSSLNILFSCASLRNRAATHMFRFLSNIGHRCVLFWPNRSQEQDGLPCQGYWRLFDSTYKETCRHFLCLLLWVCRHAWEHASLSLTPADIEEPRFYSTSKFSACRQSLLGQCLLGEVTGIILIPNWTQELFKVELAKEKKKKPVRNDLRNSAVCAVTFPCLALFSALFNILMWVEPDHISS